MHVLYSINEFETVEDGTSLDTYENNEMRNN